MRLSSYLRNTGPVDGKVSSDAKQAMYTTAIAILKYTHNSTAYVRSDFILGKYEVFADLWQQLIIRVITELLQIQAYATHVLIKMSQLCP